jgi:hypothetical protein
MRHEYVMCQANDIKQKSLLGDNLTKKKKICFLFALSFIFYILLYVFILFYSFSFISTLKTMLCLKCWGGFWFSLLFLCVLLELEEPIKKYLCFPTLNIKFYLFNFHWFMRIWVLCMRISWDRWKYKLNEWVCMQVLSLISLEIDFENMSCWLNSVVPM